jgi:hypothetical protein
MRNPPKQFFHTGVPRNDCGDGARQRDEAAAAFKNQGGSPLPVRSSRMNGMRRRIWMTCI